VIYATIQALAYEKDRLVYTYPEKQANSLVSNFMKTLYSAMNGSDIKVISTGGSEVTLSPSVLYFSLTQSVGEGMRIGSGANPVTMADYRLQSEITTNISFSGHNFVVSIVNDATARLEITRSFTNTSGSSIQVNEVALYTRTGGYVAYMIDRTLYQATIPAYGGITVTYRIYIVV